MMRGSEDAMDTGSDSTSEDRPAYFLTFRSMDGWDVQFADDPHALIAQALNLHAMGKDSALVVEDSSSVVVWRASGDYMPDDRPIDLQVDAPCDCDGGLDVHDVDGHTADCASWNEVPARTYLHYAAVRSDGTRDSFQTIGFDHVQDACEHAAASIVGEASLYDPGATCSMLGIGVDAQEVRHAIATPDLYANSDDPVDAVAVVLESVAQKDGYAMVEYAGLRVEMQVVR